MNKIETYDDLLKEELALQSSLAIQKDIIQKEIIQIRENLEPVRKTVSFLSKFVTRGNTSALVGTGIGILGDIVFKNVILAKSGWVARLVLPYLVKNYSSHIVTDKPSILQNIVQTIKSGWKSKEAKMA